MTQAPAVTQAPIIAIVDDDASVRRALQRLVKSAGYTVLTARDGTEALAIAEQSDEPIHVLITDVVLPGRYDGFALARQAKALRPRLKVFYASGYYSSLPASGDDDAFYGKFIAKKRPLDFLRSLQLASAADATVQGLMVGDGPLRPDCEEFVRATGAPAVFAGFDPQRSGPSFEWAHLAVVAAWGVAGLVVAIRRFRWEPAH